MNNVSCDSKTFESRQAEAINWSLSRFQKVIGVKKPSLSAVVKRHELYINLMDSQLLRG